MSNNRNPNKKAFQLYYDACENMCESLTDDQIGKIMRAIIQLEIHGEETEFDDPLLRFIYNNFKSSLERNNEKYEHRCEVNRQNANKRWQQEKDVSKNEGDP